MSGTKKNHFVPQGYLKEFFAPNGVIYRYDKSSRKPKPFFSTTPIGFENDLYTLKDKITKADMLLFERILPVKLSVEDREIINLLVNFLNDDMANLIQITTLNKKAEIFINNLNKTVLNNQSNISRTQELLCTMHENCFYAARNLILEANSIAPLYPVSVEFQNPKYFVYFNLNCLAMNHLLNKLQEHILTNQKLIQEEIDTLKSLREPCKYKYVPYYDLFFYAIFQIFRIPRMIKNTFKRFGNSNKFSFLMLQYDTIRYLANWHADGMKPILLKNTAKIPFITSDRPSINLYGKLVTNAHIVDGAFELYFPISNKLAILWSERLCYKNIHEIAIDSDDEIKRYNRQIFDNADKYVFSAQENILDVI